MIRWERLWFRSIVTWASWIQTLQLTVRLPALTTSLIFTTRSSSTKTIPLKSRGEERTGTDYTSQTGEEYYGEGNNYFTNYLFNTTSSIPMLRFVEVATKTHAIWPSECFDIWTTWFTNYTKDPDTLELYYQGELVDTTVTP